MRVDAVSKVADLEVAEKEKMKAKVDRILKHDMNVFINRCVMTSCRALDILCFTCLTKDAVQLQTAHL